MLPSFLFLDIYCNIYLWEPFWKNVIALKLLCYLKQWQWLSQNSVLKVSSLLDSYSSSHFSKVLILKRAKLFNTCNVPLPLGSKWNVHTDWLLQYGCQCSCVDILTLKLKLPEIVLSRHCAHLWFSELTPLPCLSFSFVQCLKTNVEEPIYWLLVTDKILIINSFQISSQFEIFVYLFAKQKDFLSYQDGVVNHLLCDCC